MKHYDILIIGGGPAGIEAAYHSAKNAPEIKVAIIEENFLLGGQLIKQTHSFFGSKNQFAGKRGIEIAKILMHRLMELNNIDIYLQTSVIGYYEDGIIAAESRDKRLLEFKAKKLIVAAGAMENMAVFEGNDLPGVFGAGAAQTLMNVYGVLPGKEVVMLGAGNIGLIVAYQLLQAGANVKAVVEGLPYIGGYHVHAAKIRRMGVPIYTSHTVIKAIGKEVLEVVEIAPIDKDWKVCGDSFRLEVDTLCLAVGLTPSIEILQQAGCRLVFVKELGGFVAWHNEYLLTSNENIYVAGDVSGIEEASTAMLEGKIAGLHAAMTITDKNFDNYIQDAFDELLVLRSGPHGERPLFGKQKLNELAF